MNELGNNVALSVKRPDLFLECADCPIATTRIASERRLSREKLGKLDWHSVLIDCQKVSASAWIMWARHTGLRHPTEGKRGYRTEGIQISGGEFVDCPGSRPISLHSSGDSLVRIRARKMLDGFNVEAEYEVLRARQDSKRRSQENDAQSRAQLWNKLARRLNQEREVVAFRSFMRRPLGGTLKCEQCGFESDKAFDWLVIFTLEEGQEVRYDADVHKLTLKGGEGLRPRGMKMQGMFWTDVTPIHQVAEGHLPTYRTGPEELVNDLFDNCVEKEWLI